MAHNLMGALAAFAVGVASVFSGNALLGPPKCVDRCRGVFTDALDCAALGGTISFFEGSHHGECCCDGTVCYQNASCDLQFVMNFSVNIPFPGCAKTRPSPVSPWSSTTTIGGSLTACGQEFAYIVGYFADCGTTVTCEDTIVFTCQACEGLCP